MARSADNFKPYARASLLLIGLMWTLPFLQPWHRFPLTSFYSEWLALALGTAAAAVLLHRAAWREAAVPALALAPLALAALVWLHGALGRSPYPGQADVAALYLVWTAALVVLGHVLARHAGATALADTLSWALLAGGVLTAAIGLVQYFQWSTPFDALIGRKVAERVFGNLGQPNHTAAYLALALTASVYLAGTRRLAAWAAAPCIALLLLVLALSASRSAWLYLGALAALAVLAHRALRDPAGRRIALVAVLLLPGFLAAHAFAALPFMTAGQGQLTSADRLFDTAVGAEARVALWGAAWRMFVDEPLAGAGWGAFPWRYFLDPAQAGAPGHYHHAHNIVLHVLAELGLAGALLLGAVAVPWALDVKERAFDAAAWWSVALVAVIVLHSLLEFPLWYAYFLGMLAVLLGAGAQRAWRPRCPAAARAVAGAVLAAGCFMLAADWSAYRAFERLLFSPESARQAERDPAFARAVTALHREAWLTPYVEYALALAAPVSEEQLADTLGLVSRAVRFSPADPLTYRYALLLALAGRTEEARAQLERALRAHPGGARRAAAELRALIERHPGKFDALAGRLAGAVPVSGHAAR